MRANELMVGDWVCYSKPNNYYTKVEEIRCTSDGEEYYIRCHRDSKDTFLEQLKYDDFSVDILHPIPLTPEILTNNDFKYEDGYGYSFVNRKELSEDGFEEEKVYINTALNTLIIYTAASSIHLPVKYIHELQHALKLCEKEKEIVL
jgi:hypothetical protein